MARPRSAGQLIIAATPIGHLQDCSARLLDALGTADIIACEDTRHTGVLLAQHHITTHRVSYHEHNERARTPALVTRMLNGDTIALVTDAGTPAVSDPGYHLIRGAIDANIQVTWIPGPAACIGALVLSGLPVHAFTFVGFLPVKAGQRATALRALYDADRTVIAYESPQRLVKLLTAIRDTCGHVQVAVCRELTKVHEEIQRGSVDDVLAHYMTHTPRGEIVVVFHPTADAAT